MSSAGFNRLFLCRVQNGGGSTWGLLGGYRGGSPPGGLGGGIEPAATEATVNRVVEGYRFRKQLLIACDNLSHSLTGSCIFSRKRLPPAAGDTRLLDGRGSREFVVQEAAFRSEAGATVLTHGPTASRGDRPTNMLTTTKMRLQHHVQ
jgi:hypothetical protein